MPRVTAVVCTYWETRRLNVDRIVDDLCASTRPPDRILILDNNQAHWSTHLVDLSERAEVIRAPNTECRGKFIAALLDVADYYLLLDDDTSVGPETIARLLAYSHDLGEGSLWRGWVTGYLGCWIDFDAPGGPSLFSETSQRTGRLWPHDATELTIVDTWCGCALWCDFQALANLVQLEAKVRRPEQWPTEGDDVLMGLANTSVVLPLRGPECFVALPDGGQAMSTAIEDYYGMRDRFLRDALRAQGRL